MTLPPALLDLAMSPYPAKEYARLRTEHGPLVWVELEPGVGAWLVLGYTENLTVLREERIYSRDGRRWRLFQDGTVPPDSPLGPMMFYRPNVVGADGVEHRRLRAPLEDALEAIEQQQLRLSVERVCQSVIDQFSPRGSADLVNDYAVIVPMLALADLCGLDTMRGYELLEALRLLVGSTGDAQEGNQRFTALLHGVIDTRRACPAADVTTTLIGHPNLRTDEEILHSLIVLVSAGYHTLTAWIASTLRLMLTDPRFAHRLHGGRLSTGDALNTVLWEEPPMLHLPARYALTDTDLAGQKIRHGDALILGLAAASTDPHIHSGVRTADNRSHLAWSAGPHACPAEIQARIITEAAVDTILTQLPGLTLTISSADIPLIPGLWSRCPATLPVAFPSPA